MQCSSLLLGTVPCIFVHFLALSYTVLLCPALSCTAMHCPVMSNIVLHCPSLSLTVLHLGPGPALSCIVLHWHALSCTGMYCPALACIVLHRPSLSCTVLHCPRLLCPAWSCTVLHCPALSCMCVQAALHFQYSKHCQRFFPLIQKGWNGILILLCVVRAAKKLRSAYVATNCINRKFWSIYGGYAYVRPSVREHV